MINFLIESDDTVNPELLEIEGKIKTVLNAGNVITKIPEKKKNTIVVYTKGDERISALNAIANAIPNAVYNPEGGASSVGRVEIKGVSIKTIYILAKPGATEKGVKINGGIQFEKDFAEECNAYLHDEPAKDNKIRTSLLNIIEQVQKENKNYKLIKYSWDGGKNQNRPLIVSGDKIICGPTNVSNFNIGPIVTDITLTFADALNPNNTKEVYLSLKFGSTVTFVNSGITKILTDLEIKDGDISNPKGRALLSMLGVDTKKFCEVFNNYKGKDSKKQPKEIVSVKRLLSTSNIFKDFMRSVMGNGYFLVHKGKDIDILNMTPAYTESMIKIKDAEIRYPIEGSAKRIDIIVHMNGIDIKINIRDKSGKRVTPTHIMADYAIHHGSKKILTVEMEKTGTLEKE